MKTRYIIISLFLATSCNLSKDNITGNYTYEINQNRNHIWQSYKLKIMAPDSFCFENEYGSMGWLVSSGKWQIKDGKIVLNSTCQISDKFFEINEAFLISNKRDSMVSLKIGYGDEYIYSVLANVNLYLESDEKNNINIDKNGEARYKMSRVENIIICFEIYDKKFIYKPINPKSNSFSIIYQCIDFENYLILEDFELKIKNNKLISDSKGKLKFKKQ